MDFIMKCMEHCFHSGVCLSDNHLSVNLLKSRANSNSYNIYIYLASNVTFTITSFLREYVGHFLIFLIFLSLFPRYLNYTIPRYLNDSHTIQREEK